MNCETIKCSEPGVVLVSVAINDDNLMVMAGHLVRVPSKKAWACEKHEEALRTRLTRHLWREVSWLNFKYALLPVRKAFRELGQAFKKMQP